MRFETDSTAATPRKAARPAKGAAWALAAAVVVAVLAPGTAAHAHSYLVSSTPEADSTLTELPDEFVITTNEELLDVSGEASSFGLQVRDEQGLYYGDGCLTVAGASMSTPAELGEAGDYTVLWQVVSADGHTVDGEFAFTWAPPTDFAPATGSETPPVCGETGTTETETQAPAPSQTDAPDAEAEAPAEQAEVDLTTLLWVAGALGAPAIAVIATVLAMSRRRK